jgi:hypothetical protein
MAPKMSKVMKSELAKPATSKQAAAVKSKLSAMAMKSKGKKLEHGPKKLEKPCGTASYHSLTYINTCIYIYMHISILFLGGYRIYLLLVRSVVGVS